MKNIVVCSDGTGNTAIKGRATNVFKLYEAIDLGVSSDGVRQIAFYDDGVGTERLRPLAVLGGAFGFGLSRNVRQLYAEIARVYEPGDRLYLFGFSRGAFTVRTLAGLIAACGIVNRRPPICDSDDDLRRKVGDAYAAYRDRYRTDLMAWLRGPASNAPESVLAFRQRVAVQHDPPAAPGAEPWQVPIEFMGVWDTVDAVGLPLPHLADLLNTSFYRFKFPDRRLGPMVRHARHALAIDDERHTFHPVLWDEERETTGRIEQVWFPGVHSNVGGGYPKQGMSLVALVWMMEEANRLGLRFSGLDWRLYRERQNVYDKLYDSRAGLAFFYRYRPRDVHRLCARDHVLPKLHVSAIERVVDAPAGYAPGNISGQSLLVGRPTPVVDKVMTAMRASLGQDTSLLDRVQRWIAVRTWSHRAVMTAALVVAVLILWDALRAPTWSWSAVASVEGLGGLAVSFVSAAFQAGRWHVLGLLAVMAVAYVVSWRASVRTRRVFSEFWFQVRP